VALITRGFHGKSHESQRSSRLPPGQHQSKDWPVLAAEPTPRLDLATWTFKIEGLVENPVTWSWDEIHALDEAVFVGDIHCVTTWSRLGMTFTGVSVDTLLTIARPLKSATHVVAFSHTGYTTNLPIADVMDGKALVVWEADSEPLPREHGGPARMIVPHLYFWKSTKWVAGMRVLDHDEPGFWETRGYNNYGDPWREQRYTGD
jgi:DMSO/TMAO reductase YedYZ molybdopterin-dependent catalytic subunit